MKKIISGLLLLAMTGSLLGTSFAARKKVYKKVYKGARPKFPKAGEVTINKVIKSQPEAKKAAPPVDKVSFLVEGGYGAGGGLIRLGMEKPMGNGRNYGAGVGYALGSGYSVVFLDLARLTLGSKELFYGASLNYAMYSNLVELTGVKITNKSLFGLGVFVGKDLGPVLGTIGFDSALGLKATASYYF